MDLIVSPAACENYHYKFINHNFCDRNRCVPEIKEDFENVSLSHIPQSKNGRADALAKETRNRGYILFHIDQTWIDGDVPRKIGSSTTI